MKRTSNGNSADIALVISHSLGVRVSGMKFRSECVLMTVDYNKH